MFQAVGGELLNRPGLTGQHESSNHSGEPVLLVTTQVLEAGEIVDLTPSIQGNEAYYK